MSTFVLALSAYIDYGQKTLHTGVGEILCGRRHYRPADLPAGRLPFLLAGLAPDGHSVHTDVCSRAGNDGKEPGAAPEAPQRQGRGE